MAVFRPQQAALFQALAPAPQQTLCVNAPPGVGKSVLAWTYAKLLGARATILTGTRGLQDQYKDDWESVGVVDVRGMGNYPCRALDAPAKCDIGPCLEGEKCLWRQAGCAFYDRVKAASEADIVTTNYAFHFAHPPGPEGPMLGERNLLVCDEAHNLPDEVAKAAGAAFDSREVEIEPTMEGWPIDQWRVWAAEKAHEAEKVMRLELTPMQRREVRSLYQRFLRLANASDRWARDWTADRRGIVKASFEPIEVAPYAEEYLFRGVEKRLLMSGTILPSIREELGIAAEDFAYFETDSPFPVERRPIIWVKCGHRVTAKSSEGQLLEHWMKTIDEAIAAGRLDYRGLIHTVSYSRAKFLKANSQYRKVMVLHTNEDTRDAVKAFKAAKPPAIFLSPSVHTGYSFDEDFARWQIIAKVPFPDVSRGIAAARAEAVRHYIQKHAARVMMQMAGRVVRSEKDWGETLVIDDAFSYLFSRFQPYFSGWFRRAVRMSDSVPKMMEVPV